MKCGSALFLAWILVLAPQTDAQSPTDAEVLAAVGLALDHLLEGIEAYNPSQDPLARSKSSKTVQNDKATEKNSPPKSEWPYEGVYRVDTDRFAREIPPGYRVGGTAIVCTALLLAPGFEQSEGRRQAFATGTDFIRRYLEEEPLMQSGFLGGYDVRGWGHAYALDVFLKGLKKNAFEGSKKDLVAKTVRRLIKTLEDTEIPEGGGWNYSRRGGFEQAKDGGSPFQTAPTLQFLFDAKAQGFEVKKDVVERALKSLERARLESGAYKYTTDNRPSKGEGFDAPAGACARMAVCETTLYLAGRGSVDRIRGATEAFFEHWEWLEKRRCQTGTHVEPYMIAPYYFHYAHTYVAQAIEQLPAAERPKLRQKLRDLYWKTREPDGDWNDRVFERSENFGSAMAILGLLMPSLDAPAKWSSQ